MSGHYKNHNSIRSIDDLKRIFPNGQANELNWCVLSTSGIHGTYTTINEIERYYDDPDKFIKEENDGAPYYPHITVLVIMPRMVSMLYGHIKVAKEDIPYLRDLVNSSMYWIDMSQTGNR